jgi:hypothetical protein
MREIVIQTLVDITETKQYRKAPELEIAYQQQQNFSMMLQAIGMRANPMNMRQPDVHQVDVKNYNFGANFTGRHTMWTFKFFIEYDGAYTDQTGNESGLLLEDLNFVPVITQLKETAKISPAVFDTKSSDTRNTLVSVVSDK